MPFYREWDPTTGAKQRNANQTGAPPSPETGTTQTSSGMIVGDNSSVSIPPATPITVTPPGPREKLFDANGNMSPRWYRFFMELYRRTGGWRDNINRTDRLVGGSSTTLAMSISSAAVTLKTDYYKSPPKASLAFSSTAPTVS